MGKVRSADWYDGVYAGAESNYRKPPHLMPYYEMWKDAILHIRDGSDIVDVGCGPGHFARMVMPERKVGYLGLDFSDEALTQAVMQCNALIDRVGLRPSFRKWDATKDMLPSHGTDYVLFEFLEHIEHDLAVLREIPIGAQVIFSVPTRDDPGHVRTFPRLEDVSARYGKIVEFHSETPHLRGGYVRWWLVTGTRVLEVV